MLDDRAHQVAQDSDILDVADLLGGFQAAPGHYGIDIGAGVVLYLRLMAYTVCSSCWL